MDGSDEPRKELKLYLGTLPGRRLRRGESITFSFYGITITYRWGSSHFWHCDDAGYIFISTPSKLLAVFDGISYTEYGYGKGGKDASRAVEILSGVKEKPLEEISRAFPPLYTTAVIAKVNGNRYEALAVGDSYLEVDGEVLNRRRLEWIGEGRWQLFRGTFTTLSLYTDGIDNPEDDLLLLSYSP